MSLRNRLRRLLTRPPPPPPRVHPPSPPPAPAEPWTLQDSALVGPLEALLDPELAAALAGADPLAVLRPLGPGLYRLPVLSAPARVRLLTELRRAQDAASLGVLDLARPNSMNEAGVQLGDIGLSALADSLCASVVAPLSAVFRELGPVMLGDPHGFSVSYGRGGDRSLGFHADDATVTLNLCLASDAQGAEVVFEGVRCTDHRQDAHRPEERIAWAPEPGEALLHLGAHRHRTLPISRGARTNLVIWCRDADRVDLAGCGPWCRHVG